MDEMCALFDAFGSVQQQLLFVDTAYHTIAQQWSLIDKWRMDKVLMVCVCVCLNSMHTCVVCK